MPAITKKSLIEERAALVGELSELDNQLSAGTGEATQERFDQKDAELRAKDAQIARFERMNALAGTDIDTDDRDHDHIGNEQRGLGDAEKDDPTVNVPEEYDILRAVRAVAANKELDGLEGEISQELAKRYGRSPDGFFMPLNIRMGNLSGRERRDFDTTAGSGGIATITSSTWIELLRNRMLATRLGARMLTGLRGDLSIPKMTGTGQAYWVTEGNAPTESQQTVGQVPLTPKTVGCYTDITRKLLKQNSRDANAIVLDDLNTIMRLELDRVAFNGSGTNPEPEGLLQNANVGTVIAGPNGGAITNDLVVNMETQVAIGNADVDTMHYVTTPRACGAAKKTQKFSNTNGMALWSDDNRMNGYDAHRTNQLPSNLTKGTGSGLSAMLFGDFSTIICGMWGGIDVMVDPYSNSTSGGVRVVLLADTDVQLRHDESVSKCIDIAT